MIVCQTPRTWQTRQDIERRKLDKVLPGDVCKSGPNPTGECTYCTEGTAIVSNNYDRRKHGKNKHKGKGKSKNLSKKRNLRKTTSGCIPKCPAGKKLCLNRKPRYDVLHEDGFPTYYIDYDAIRCVDENINCGLCTPGRFCKSEMRCIEIGNKYEGCLEWW